jgi:putative cell wall-binding protein
VPVSAISRVAGGDRVATAIAASQDLFPAAHSAGAVVLARDDDFADALAGTPLAAAKGGPLLLTPTAALDSRVLAEIQRVLPAGGTVYILGGEDAISAAVAQAITAAGDTVVRYAGPDRFATAVTVAHLGLGDPSTILLATGLNFADGLAAGPAAAVSHGAILLTNGTTEATATSTYLAAHPADTVWTIGGPAAAADPSATPIVGTDRYFTAGLVASRFFPSTSLAGVATGLQFPDALSGGAEMAELAGPILLTEPDSLSAGALAYLTATGTIKAVKVFGGTNAMTGATLAQI